MNKGAQMQTALRRRLESELLPGERVLWAVQPVAARAVRKDLWALPFFLLWTGFSLSGFIEFAGILADGKGMWVGAIGAAFLSVFVLVGLSGMTIPFFGWRLAKHTIYAVTDRRVLVLKGAGSYEIHSFALSGLDAPIRVQRADGGGDLVVKVERRGGESDPETRHVLSHLPDARDAERAVKAALAGIASSRPGVGP